MKTISIFSFYLAFCATLWSCQGDKQNQGQQEDIATDQPSENEELPTDDPGLFEMRTYYAADGKLDDLIARFKNHTVGIFERHGMVNIGYWTPVENPDNKLVYVLGYKDREQREQAWKAFADDPDWKTAKETSEESGKLVDSVKKVFMRPTDYSPAIEFGDKGPRVFELRTYFTNDGKLDALHSRFRDHTMTIFENNGMSNIMYFSLVDDQEGHDNTLVYFISHADQEQAGKNWAGFMEDPDWKTAYEASIVNGNLVKELTSEYLQPLDFSAIK